MVESPELAKDPGTGHIYDEPAIPLSFIVTVILCVVAGLVYGFVLAVQALF